MWAGVALVFAAAIFLLRPVAAPRADGEYVAMAKATPEGRQYFAVYPATCQVTRAWTVQVACDYLPAGAQLIHFRAYIDPRTDVVLEVLVGSSGGL